jgi:hypothetical protein
VSNRDLPEVRRLLAKGGGDPNMLCPDSFVRLHASEKFRAGQAQNTGRSLLHHAAWAGDLEVFKAIVDAGGDIDRKRNTVWRPNGGVNGRGNKPLHFAVMYNRKAIVEYLLDLGADVNAAGEQGYTPLHISVKFNFPELMELLLLSGARTDMITRDEKTARHGEMGRREHHRGIVWTTEDSRLADYKAIAEAGCVDFYLEMEYGKGCLAAGTHG